MNYYKHIYIITIKMNPWFDCGKYLFVLDIKKVVDNYSNKKKTLHINFFF